MFPHRIAGVPQSGSDYNLAFSQRWTAAQLGLQIWHDASDVSTFTFSSGTRVSAWANKGSSGGSYTQASAAVQPEYQSSYNGYPALVGDATGRSMNRAGIAWTEMSMFCVFQNASTPGTNWCLYEFGTAATSGYTPLAADAKIYDTSGTTARKDAIVPGKALNTPTLITVTSQSGAWTMWIDGVQVYTTAVNTVGSAATLWLMRSAAGSSAYEGGIREFGVRTTVFTTEERGALTTAMKAKWGIP